MKRILLIIITTLSINIIINAQAGRDTVKYNKATFEAKIDSIAQKMNKSDSTWINAKINLKADKTSLNGLGSRISNDSLYLKQNYLSTVQTRTAIGDSIADEKAARISADNLKANLNSPTFTGHVSLPASTQIGNIDSTELSYLNNLTGNVQLKLNEKATITSLNTVESNLTAALNQKLNYNISSYEPVGSNDVTLGSMPIYLEAGEVVKIKPGEMPVSDKTNTLILDKLLEVQNKLDQINANIQSNSDANYNLNQTIITLTARIDTLEQKLNITPPPTINTPTNLVATGHTGYINLSWIASGNRDGFELYGERTQPTAISFTKITTLDSATTTYDHTGLGGASGGSYFAISNESGNTTDYSSVVNTSGANLTVTNVAKNGTYGLKYITTATTSVNAYVTKTTTSKDTIYGAFYIKSDIDTFQGTWSSGYFLELKDVDSSKSRLRFGIKSGSTAPISSWDTEIRLPNGQVLYNTTTSKLTDYLSHKWLYIEYEYIASATGGGYRIWVDSTLIIDKLIYNTAGTSIEERRLGFPYNNASGKPTLPSYAYFDSWNEGNQRLDQWTEYSSSESWRYYVKAYKGTIYSGPSNFAIATSIGTGSPSLPPPDTTGTGTGVTVSGQWFVVKGATGDNSGRSYTNGIPDFASIPWSNISAGDTLVIGSQLNADTTYYNEQLTIKRSDIVITRSTALGYNGVVIIDGQNTRPYCILNENSAYDNVTVNGINKNKFILKGFTSQGIRFRYNSNLTAKNFTILLNVNSAFSGIFLYGGEWESPPSFSGPYTIEDFIIIQDSGSYAGGGNSDGIQAGGVDGLTVRNGFIRLWNADPNPHSDGIQMYHCKNILLEQNQIYHFNAGATSNKQGIYITNSGGNVRIRNNFISLASESFGSAIAFEQYDNTWWTVYTPPDTLEILNNTVFCTYDNPNSIRLVQSISATDFSANMVMKNNIFVTGGFAIDRKFFTSGSNCDYNNYYDVPSVSIYDQNTTSTGTSRTWAAWQGLGFDTHSVITNPTLSGYIPANYVYGIDLSSFGYSDDLLGITRTGSWWIGCYQP